MNILEKYLEYHLVNIHDFSNMQSIAQNIACNRVSD